MNDLNIQMEGGTSIRLLTQGKYCDKNIVVTADGAVLPELTNPASAEQIVEGYDAINGAGAVVSGANPYEKAATDAEVDTQAGLIRQIKTVLNGKAAGDGGGDPDIPAGYVRCNYIQFTGEQTIDTGIVCNQDTKIKTVFTREKSSAHYMFGVVSSDNTASVTAYLGGNWRFGNKAMSKNTTTDADIIYSGILSSSEITTTASETAISGVNDFETVGSLLIGSCRNASGTIGAAQFEGKIFAWLMWSGGELVQKLVPVVSADGVYCFWDTVTQTFFNSIKDTPLEGGNL